ncbi:energy transducer TonB [Hyphomicrobium sp. CS1BSMeth3]|uniref:energy transducer TonB n=1 Tax=Hyphomicrobium sp. CS1BSMeth3 TaxID=1892844 RepID=UPI001574F891|nr:energy transducer TonB [Hyphomicrobium sp. CS1BSMeth3]
MAEEEPNDLDRPVAAGPTGELLRLAIVSAIAVVLLAGGVYWLHRIPSRPMSKDAGATVQVRLMPAEIPTPFPAATPAEVPGLKTGRERSDDATRDVEPQHVAPVPSELPDQPRPPTVPQVSPRAKAAHRPSSEEALRFQQTLRRHIARFQRYPAEARQARMEGTVHVVFRLRRDGTVADVWLKSPSGRALLDREALETIRRAEPMPVIPTELPDQLNILLPIAFDVPK